VAAVARVQAKGAATAAATAVTATAVTAKVAYGECPQPE